MVVSYVSYESAIVALEPNQTSITIKLKVEQQQLTEVMVSYGTQKKKDLTGSVSSITSEHMTLGGTTFNIAQAVTR